MYRTLTITIVWFALAFSAFGVSVEIPVTPKRLDLGEYVFSVSTNAEQGGVAFHIVISAKAGDIFSDSAVGVSIVTHTKGCSEIVPAKPEVKIALKEDRHFWTADFVASRRLLQTAGACFVFTAYTHVVMDGKTVGMPSAEFFEIKLLDFTKP